MYIPSAQITILDGSSRQVAQGTVGEVCLRGPNVTSGYRNRPEANEEVSTCLGPTTKPYVVPHTPTTTCLQLDVGVSAPPVVQQDSHRLTVRSLW